jgi:hypothetical protein
LLNAITAIKEDDQLGSRAVDNHISILERVGTKVRLVMSERTVPPHYTFVALLDGSFRKSRAGTVVDKTVKPINEWGRCDA